MANNLFRSSNPMFRDENMRSSSILDQTSFNEGTMTVEGAVNKSLILFGILMLTSAYAFLNPNYTLMWVGIIGGLIASLVGIFKPQYAPYAAPAYAAFEGLAIGTISIVYASLYAGIVFQAATLTFGVLFLMLTLYKARIITVTEKLRSGIMMATGAIALLYLVNMILYWTMGYRMPFIHEGGTFGIIFSLAVVALASFNLLLDFDNIERGAQMNAPKYMEWASAMGLLITLVWLYLEILRLLAKLQDR